MKLYRFLMGRGLYAVLALILMAVTGIAVAIYASPAPTEPSQDPVDQNVSDIPNTRPTTPLIPTPTTTPTTTEPALPTLPTTEPPAVKPTTPPAPLRVLPLSNAVLLSFSGNAPIYNPTLHLWHTHNGVDFAGQTGQQVRAVCDGTVTAIRQEVRLGNLIEIRHTDGSLSRYAGVEPTVKQGDKVSASQTIGTLTEVPFEAHLQPHLHLEIEVNGTLTDPVAYIGVTVHQADAPEQKP